MKKQLVIGMSGASGAPLAVELLQQMKNQNAWETHLVMTRGAEMTLEEEMNLTCVQIERMATHVYDNHNIGAAIASGSFRVDGMVIIPCSMKTVAGIASGYSENLLLRAADVTIKEGRKLVLVPRECPLSQIHLRNMYELSQMGVVMIPPMLSYYNRPETVEECTRHIVGKVLDQFDMEGEEYQRWQGMQTDQK